MERPCNQPPIHLKKLRALFYPFCQTGYSRFSKGYKGSTHITHINELCAWNGSLALFFFACLHARYVLCMWWSSPPASADRRWWATSPPPEPSSLGALVAGVLQDSSRLHYHNNGSLAAAHVWQQLCSEPNRRACSWMGPLPATEAGAVSLGPRQLGQRWHNEPWQLDAATATEWRWAICERCNSRVNDSGSASGSGSEPLGPQVSPSQQYGATAAQQASRLGSRMGQQQKRGPDMGQWSNRRKRRGLTSDVVL
jgi:hypothetical protein